MNSKQEGFSIIEILVTIVIVGIGLVGIISFFSANIQNQLEVKNELIAAGLAQEGPELVRNIVDYNYLNGADWYDKVCGSNSDCAGRCKSIDHTALTGHDCITTDQPGVCLAGTPPKYEQCDSSELPFERSISISIENVYDDGVNDLNNGDCLKVSNNVTWNDRTTVATDIVCKPRQ